MSSKSKKNTKLKNSRKITFLQGKEDATMNSFKQSDGQEINAFFYGLILNHPECAFKNQRFNKTDPEGADHHRKNPLKDELIFGIKEVMRRIQKKLVIGVVIKDPITIHLKATIFDLCKEFDVAISVSKNLENLANVLGISKLTCFGLTEKVKDPSSLCHPLFQTFEKLTANLPHEIIKKGSNITQQQTKSDKIKNEDIFIFDMPPEENFFIEIGKSSSPSDIVKFNDTTVPKLKMADFIAVEETINYFPSRSFFNHIDITIPWIGIQPEIAKTTNLGKQLFSIKSFAEPKTVHLTSSGRPKNKKSKFNKNK